MQLHYMVFKLKVLVSISIRNYNSIENFNRRETFLGRKSKKSIHTKNIKSNLLLVKKLKVRFFIRLIIFNNMIFIASFLMYLKILLYFNKLSPVFINFLIMYRNVLCLFAIIRNIICN